MKPGREMDALVAERVFGLKYRARWFMGVIDPRSPDGTNMRPMGDMDYPAPPYSTDIAAAWEVVEKFGQAFDRLYFSGGKWECWIEPSVGERAQEFGDSAPHAICLAALSAVQAL